MHHCMTNTEQILDMVGPHRVPGEPTVLYFIWFHVGGVKLCDIVQIHPYVPFWGAVEAVAAPSHSLLLVTIWVKVSDMNHALHPRGTLLSPHEQGLTRFGHGVGFQWYPHWCSVYTTNVVYTLRACR